MHPCSVVIAGLDPAIHSAPVQEIANATNWMPGPSPGMTTGRRETMADRKRRVALVGTGHRGAGTWGKELARRASR